MSVAKGCGRKDEEVTILVSGPKIRGDWHWGPRIKRVTHRISLLLHIVISGIKILQKIIIIRHIFQVSETLAPTFLEN